MKSRLLRRWISVFVLSVLAIGLFASTAMAGHNGSHTGKHLRLYRMYSGSILDHFYTNSTAEYNAAASSGYAQEGVMASTQAATGKTSTSQALRRLWSSQATDHFYTTNAAESASAQGAGYVLEGDAGYCEGAQQSATFPLFRLYHPGGDHFYTIDQEEALNSTRVGWDYEGIACYVSGASLAISGPYSTP